MSNKYPGGLITSGANAGYSVAFDGTGDYLSIADNAALDMGASDFTMECFVYLNENASSADGIFAKRTDINTFGGVLAFINVTTPNFYATVNGSSWGVAISSSISLSLNTWNHLAFTRSGNTWTVWVNGASGGTATVSGTVPDNSSAFVIGAYSSDGNGTYLFPSGYISNARVVKGTALYTSAFTRPTQLLNVTNTNLLTCNSPAIVDQSSNAFPITANGNAAVSTFTPFTGTQLVPNPNTLANTQGVWTISQAAYWMSQNKWPMPPSYPLQSLRFNSADSAYLNRTPGSAGNRTTWTWSGWVKRTKLATNSPLFCAQVGETTGLLATFFGFGTGDTLVLYTDTLDTANIFTFASAAVFRDVSAWYHIVLAYDSTQATASNRAKLYINGVQQTFTLTNGTLSQNYETAVNATVSHAIGRFKHPAYSAYLNDGYITDTYFINAQALTPSSFGANDPNTGVWSPVPYSGTYGTNGFRLSFQDNTGTTATTLGKDYSGNGNNWTPNNFSVAAGSGNDSLTDGPTNWGIDYGNGGEVRGNYATLNPLSGLTTGTLSNGNLDLVGSTTTDSMRHSTIGIASGKWYTEITVNVASSSATMGLAVYGQSAVGTVNATPSRGYYHTGQKYSNGTLATYGNSFTNGDVIGIAVDVGAGKIWFSKNGTWQASGDPAAGTNAAYTDLSTTETWFLTVQTGSTGTAASCSWNFGQRPFSYPAPSGFKVLCTTNLPIPTVGATSTTQADDYFNVVTYTGTGSSLSVTGVGFQPDFVWVKGRSGATDHALYDAVRGVQKQLESNTTTAETTETTGLTAFGTDGFTVGSLAQVNTNAATYVGWAWKANGAGSSNTAGSITSTVSANQTAGISIVTYTGNGTSGATVGHGLGVAPRMVITKKRETGGTDGWWATYHASLSANTNLMLNSTSAAAGTASWTQGIIGGVSSSTFTLTSGGLGAANVNDNTYDYVAYCFAEIAGFSKFGSFTGNGSSDGPFVYCGFRPRYIMIKRTDGIGSDWVVWDAVRSPTNIASGALYPNGSLAQDGTDMGDFLSNGVKFRQTVYNVNGATYIFAAFAESPFNYSRAR